jgi:hypothetical protein
MALVKEAPVVSGEVIDQRQDPSIERAESYARPLPSDEGVVPWLACGSVRIRWAQSPAAQVVGQFSVLPEPGPGEILSACRMCRTWRDSLARLPWARWPW